MIRFASSLRCNAFFSMCRKQKPSPTINLLYPSVSQVSFLGDRYSTHYVIEYLNNITEKEVAHSTEE